MPDPIMIDFISDPVCPWCAIGWRQLDVAIQETRIEAAIRWRPFALNPDMAAEGENLRAHLAAKYGTTLEGSIAARARITQIGRDLGFAFNYADDMRMVNTWRAHQLIAWAADQGRAQDVAIALFAAFFTRREDLNDPAVLAEIARRVGLDAEDAVAALADGRYADSVREEERLWRARGVQGVPAVVLNGRVALVGAQGAERYADALRRAASGVIAA
ncbi:MAG: DsbA family oxidoreductase [Pseudomonadota bacterium]